MSERFERPCFSLVEESPLHPRDSDSIDAVAEGLRPNPHDGRVPTDRVASRHLAEAASEFALLAGAHLTFLNGFLLETT